MKFDTLLKIGAGTLLVASMTFVSACDSDDDEDDAGTGAATAGTTGDTTGGTAGDGDGDGDGETAEIRVMHLGVNVPAVDVFANEGDTPAFAGAEFGQSTAYAAVPAGNYSFQVSLAGDTAADAVLTVPSLDLAAGMKYTAAAIGDLNETDGAPAPTVIALSDDDSGIAADAIRIQVVHAAPAVGQVDVWNVTDPSAPAALLMDVDFGVSAVLPDLPAAAYDIGLDVDDDAMPDVVFSVDASELGGIMVNAYASNDDTGAVALRVQTPTGDVLPIAPN